MPTILVVDDNPGDRDLVCDMLRSMPEVSMLHAQDGNEGLEVIAHKKPDLVLTDLRMPNKDGLELVREMAKSHTDIPVILMASNGSEHIAVEALKEGASSYVAKNSMAEHLGDTVKQLLDLSKLDRHRERLRGCMKSREVSFELDNDPELISPLITYILDEPDRVFQISPADRMPIGMALQEALHNALYHGNLGLSSELREDDISNYFNEAARRRELDPYKDRRIFVNIKETTTQVDFIIQDEGDGFDPNKVPDPTEPENMERVSGRGLLLIRTFMDEVKYNDKGNQIHMIKRAVQDEQA